METGNTKYERAAKRVKELKGFYNHIKIFVFINGFFYLLRSGVLDSLLFKDIHMEAYYFDWVHVNVLIWLLILVVHGLFTYRNRLPFLKNWEERQIKKYMEEEEGGSKKIR